MVIGELPNVQRLVSCLMSEFYTQWKVGLGITEYYQRAEITAQNSIDKTKFEERCVNVRVTSRYFIFAPFKCLPILVRQTTIL